MDASRFCHPDKYDASGETLATLLWLSSSYWYYNKIQKGNKNLTGLVLFGLASTYASYGIGMRLGTSGESRAARLNNRLEMQHQRELGNL